MYAKFRKFRRKDSKAKDMYICDRVGEEQSDGKLVAVCFLRDLFGILVYFLREKIFK